MTDQERRELGEALVRVTEERDQERAKRDQDIDAYSEVCALAARYQTERDEWKAAANRATENAIDHANRRQFLLDEYLSERAKLLSERDEARDEVVRLNGLIIDYAKELQTLRESAAETSTVVHRLFGERNEARDEVVRLGRQGDEVRDENRRLRDQLRFADARIARDAAEFVRLRTIIGELGASEAAEPDEQVEALRSGAADEGTIERVGAFIANDIRAELVCCDIYERAYGDEKAVEAAERNGHAICFWGEAAARIAEGRDDDGGLGAAEAAEPPEPSITPSLPSAYDPERDQLVVLAETPEPPEHACNCTPMVSDAACPEHGMREFLRQVFEALDAEPPEGIEALRPGGAE